MIISIMSGVTAHSGGVSERRLDAIEALVASGQRLTVTELAARLGVSAVTIRRDLRQLEQAGRVVRTHGGAVAADDLPFADRLDLARPQKECIGRAAAEMIRPGDSIILDSGSTPYLTARRLADVSGLTVVTNSIPVVEALKAAAGIEVVLLGGVLSRHSMAFTGPTVRQQLEGIHVRLALLGADGLTVERGAQAAGAEAAASARLMAEHAEQVVVLADGSKLGRNAMSAYLPARDMYTLITAGELDETSRSEIERLRDLGVRVVIADAGDGSID
jgi:DeoR/GlpR family transcriptional regulator of sugar metabolism